METRQRASEHAARRVLRPPPHSPAPQACAPPHHSHRPQAPPRAYSVLEARRGLAARRLGGLAARRLVPAGLAAAAVDPVGMRE